MKRGRRNGRRRWKKKRRERKRRAHHSTPDHPVPRFPNDLSLQIPQQVFQILSWSPTPHSHCSLEDYVLTGISAPLPWLASVPSPLQHLSLTRTLRGPGWCYINSPCTSPKCQNITWSPPVHLWKTFSGTSIQKLCKSLKAFLILAFFRKWPKPISSSFTVPKNWSTLANKHKSPCCDWRASCTMNVFPFSIKWNPSLPPIVSHSPSSFFN